MYKLNASQNFKDQNEKLLSWLKTYGRNIDSYGHATKYKNGKKYRYKFQKTTIRHEMQVVHDSGKSWIRLQTLSYSKIKVPTAS